MTGLEQLEQTAAGVGAAVSMGVIIGLAGIQLIKRMRDYNDKEYERRFGAAKAPQQSLHNG